MKLSSPEKTEKLSKELFKSLYNVYHHLLCHRQTFGRNEKKDEKCPRTDVFKFLQIKLWLINYLFKNFSACRVKRLKFEVDGEKKNAFINHVEIDVSLTILNHWRNIKEITFPLGMKYHCKKKSEKSTFSRILQTVTRWRHNEKKIYHIMCVCMCVIF